MDWSFGTFLWSMLVFFFWVVTIWMFVAVFVDIARRDMSGWAKAGWIVLIVFLPFLGILIYLIARPRGVDWSGYPSSGARNVAAPAAAEIDRAARLLDQGKITTDEYEILKRQALRA